MISHKLCVRTHKELPQTLIVTKAPDISGNRRTLKFPGRVNGIEKSILSISCVDWKGNGIERQALGSLKMKIKKNYASYSSTPHIYMCLRMFQNICCIWAFGSML